MSSETDNYDDLLRRLEDLVRTVRGMRMHRKLQEFPPGHPEEPAALVAWRQQNPKDETRD